MKKQILSTLAGFMLATSVPTGASPLAYFAALAGAQAAGFLCNNERFNTSLSQASQTLRSAVTQTADTLCNIDHVISRNLPENIRASEECLNAFYKAKKVMKIKRPVIVENADRNKQNPNAKNPKIGRAISVPYIGFVEIDEKALKQYNSATAIHNNYHELAHILNNHSVGVNALIYHSHYHWTSLASYSLLSILSTYDNNHIFSIPYALLHYHLTLCEEVELDKINNSSLEIKRMKELEADTDAARFMALSGEHTDALKHDLQYDITNHPHCGGEYRDRGEKYPTINESIALTYNALKSINEHRAFETHPIVQKIIQQYQSDNPGTLSTLKEIFTKKGCTI